MRPDRQARIAAGLCQFGCGRTLATQNTCRQCADLGKARNRNRQKAQAASGFCIQGCGRPLVTRSHCRECADLKTERRHGLTRGTIEIVRRSIPACQACGIVLEDGCGPAGRCIDHNHSTGTRRGVLCGACNRTLGAAKDSTERLEALIVYLKRCNARDKQ